MYVLKHEIAVQKLNPKVKSGKVIRSAVITNWLKSYDVQMVQYIAGHKFVSSREKYEAFNIDDLECGLENFHPLGDRSLGEGDPLR